MACLQIWAAGNWRVICSAGMQRGGCENAEEVAAAFRRIVESGMKGAPIHPMDLLTVRSCGQKVVETYRKKALQV